jgi:hypothetical protein
MKLSEKTISLQTIPFFVLQSNANVSLPLSCGVHPTLVRQLLPKLLLTQQIPLSIALSLYLSLLAALKTLEMLLKTPENSDTEQNKPLFSLLMKFIGLINLHDSFLPVVEDGSIVFVGATTENSSFHLITPLFYRCRVLTLNPFQPHHLVLLLNRVVADTDKGLIQCLGFGSGSSKVDVNVSNNVVDFIANNCDGDAHVALYVLEIAFVNVVARVQRDNQEFKDVVSVSVSMEDANEALQCKHIA